MCGLGDIILEKNKKGKLTENKCFVPNEEVLDFFHGFFNIPTIEKLSFIIAHVRILGSMEFRKTINDFFCANASKNNVKFKKDYAEKFSEATGIEIQSQH